jgi:antitoxin MazE
MRARIVRIGNSRGVRIPKALLDECRFGDTVELEAQKGQLVIRPVDQVRTGWDDAFSRMAERGDDALLDREALGPTEWDVEEWEW